MKTGNKKSKTPKNNLAVDLPPTSNSFDLRKLEFDLWLEEYQIVHNQILRRLEADEKGYESLIITLSAIVAASSLVINYKAYFLLLLLSLPFQILIWDNVKRSVTGAAMWRYATYVVAPRLDSIVQSKEAEKFIGWESYVTASRSNRSIRFIRFLPKSGRTLLQFGASLILVVLYFGFTKNNDYKSEWVDTLLITINIVAAAISLFVLGARKLSRLSINKKK